MRWFIVGILPLSMFMGTGVSAQSCQEVTITQMQALEETTGKSKTPRHQTTYWPDFTVPMSIKNDLTYHWEGDISCGLFAPVAENKGYFARWEYVGLGKDARGSECVTPEVRGVSPKGQITVTVMYRGVPSVVCEYSGWGAGQGSCTTLKPITYGEGCASSDAGRASGGWVVPVAVLLALIIGGVSISRRKLHPLILFEPKHDDVHKKKRDCDGYAEKVKICQSRVEELEYELSNARDKLEDAERAAKRDADELFDRGTNDVTYYEGRVERYKEELARAEENLKQAEKDLDVCLST